MKIINDDRKLNEYIERFKLDQVFETDIRKHMTLIQFERNETILEEDQHMENFYFIVEGKAKIFRRSSNGKSVLLRFTRPLSELGSLEFLHQARVAHTEVEAVFKTVIISIPFNIIETVCARDVAFLKYIINRLSHKLDTLSKSASMNVTYPFKNRFASYLISITRINQIDRVDEINFDKLTELATYLGTSYRHLNRTIEELRKEGIIEKQNHKIIIKDYDQLKALSGGYYE